MENAKKPPKNPKKGGYLFGWGGMCRIAPPPLSWCPLVSLKKNPISRIKH
jgi:hypothetical protein